MHPSDLCTPPQSDLVGEGFLGNINQLEEYCKEKGFEGWFETSAKENTGIEEAARFLVSKVSVTGKGRVVGHTGGEMVGRWWGNGGKNSENFKKEKHMEVTVF